MLHSLTDVRVTVPADCSTPGAVTAGIHPGEPHCRSGGVEPGRRDGGVTAPRSLAVKSLSRKEEEAIIGHRAHRLRHSPRRISEPGEVEWVGEVVHGRDIAIRVWLLGGIIPAVWPAAEEDLVEDPRRIQVAVGIEKRLNLVQENGGLPAAAIGVERRIDRARGIHYHPGYPGVFGVDRVGGARLASVWWQRVIADGGNKDAAQCRAVERAVN